MVLIFIPLLIFLALLGTPLFVIIGAAALLAFHLTDIDLTAVTVEMYRLASAPMLLAIPLFTFAGYILAESNAPKRLVRLSEAFLGWMPGGLALVALASCAVFTAFTGASGITIVALGGLLYPALMDERYSENFSLGLLTSSGSLGLLFPPSLPIILYGVVSGTSIDKLFAAGIIPGIILMILLGIYCIAKGRSVKVAGTRFSPGDVWSALKNAAWEVPLPFLILSGIYSGRITVTEAAAFAAVYAIIIEVFVYRDLRLFKDIPRIMHQSMVLVGGILIILGSALGFTSFLIDAQVPMKILGFMKTYMAGKIVFLMALNIFLLVVGCLMDIFSAIIVVVPLIVPVAREIGIDPIHLGIIFLTNLQIGYSTPPVGINLFISSLRFNKPILQLYKATLPFLVILIIALLLITYLPALSLTLVNMLFPPQ